MTMSGDNQPDLLSDLSDMDFVRHLLADLHDDLPEKVGRFRMLADLGGQMGRSGTMIFGGHAAYPPMRSTPSGCWLNSSAIPK